LPLINKPNETLYKLFLLHSRKNERDMNQYIRIAIHLPALFHMHLTWERERHVEINWQKISNCRVFLSFLFAHFISIGGKREEAAAIKGDIRGYLCLISGITFERSWFQLNWHLKWTTSSLKYRHGWMDEKRTIGDKDGNTFFSCFEHTMHCLTFMWITYWNLRTTNLNVRKHNCYYSSSSMLLRFWEDNKFIRNFIFKLPCG
jgi:hypothetical protein